MNTAWFNLQCIGLTFIFVLACQFLCVGVCDMKLMEAMKREKLF